MHKGETWIKKWRDSGVSVQVRTNYHYSLYLDNHRIDYWPKRKRYHVLSSGKRGKLSNAGELLELFAAIEESDDDVSKKVFSEEEALWFLKEWYGKEFAGKKISVLYKDRPSCMYEIDNEKFCFSVWTNAKKRPDELTLPPDVESLLARKGNQVYFDCKVDGVVVWYNSRRIELKFYKKKNDSYGSNERKKTKYI